MVIEPLSLTFFSVSCAAAWKPSESAAAKNRMRFMCGNSLGKCRLRKNFTLVIEAGGRVSHAVGEGGKHRHAEGRVGLHQVEEDLPVDGEQHAVGLGVGVGGARPLVDQGHLAEYAARADPLHDG